MLRRFIVFLTVFILIASLLLDCPANAAEPLAKPDLEKIDDYVERMMKECRIPGLSLAIVNGEGIVYTQGYGIADPSGRRVTPQTPFIVASMSKTFTALAVMQLAEAGKVSLDEPVRTYLPWFRLADDKASQAITVRDLLSHTSGIGPSAEFSIASLRGDDTTIEQMVRKMSRVRPTAPVGSKFQYNNANYIILGEMIQAVSGVSYEEYIKQNIFRPLDMLHSYLSQAEAKKDGMAEGYRTVFGFPAVSGLPYRTDLIPAAGVITCSEDLSKYMLALMSGGMYEKNRIISTEGLAGMFKPNASISKWESYGLGWYVTSGSYYHGGELTDYQSKLKIMPEEDLGVAFVYNTSSSTATTLFNAGYRDRIESGIINILYGFNPDDVPRGGILDLNSYPMPVVYGLYLVLCLLIILILVFSFIRLRSFRKRLMNRRRRLLPALLFTLAVDFILPSILLFVPSSLHFTWAQILFQLPDVGYFTLLVVAGLLTCGVFKAAVIIGILLSAGKGQKAGRLSRYS